MFLLNTPKTRRHSSQSIPTRLRLAFRPETYTVPSIPRRLVSALLLSSPFTPADRSSLHLPSQAQTCVPLHPTRTYIHAPKSQPINQPVFSLFLCFFCHDSGKVCLGLIASHNTHGAPDLVRGEKTPRVVFAILLPVTRQATKPIQYISTHQKY